MTLLKKTMISIAETYFNVKNEIITNICKLGTCYLLWVLERNHWSWPTVRYLGLTYSAESVYDSGSEIARVKLMKYARELKMEEEGEKGQKLASIKRDILPCKVIRVEKFQFLSWITLFIQYLFLSPFVLKEVFEGIVLTKIIFPFPWNPYLRTDVTSLLILLSVKNIKEKEIAFLTEPSKNSF